MIQELNHCVEVNVVLIIDAVRTVLPDVLTPFFLMYDRKYFERTHMSRQLLTLLRNIGKMYNIT